MKTFHCTRCQNLVFFENILCLNCRHDLAYLPDQMEMAALAQDAEGLWRCGLQAYKLCTNHVNFQICNWAIPIEDPEALCLSCRLTHIIPDLDQPVNREAWHQLEIAKRRLIYTLLALGLPLAGKTQATSEGVGFEFLNDSKKPNGDRSRVLTGHDNGLITINVAEANDVYRERQRSEQHEPYRTLLGHFRHEIGHYYWDRLIPNSPRQTDFRRVFGDETIDYQQSLTRHYNNGPPTNWEEDYISAYASTHPWEDWAESWAHVLHMIDALETARSVGLLIQPRRHDEPSLATSVQQVKNGQVPFNELIQAWLPLTYVLNNLTRGLGLADGYPFVLSARVVEKLRFVYDTIKKP
jgi:hypothetical protein